jgi:uncharacterized cupredoxin-like copper-binding protein
VRSRTLMLIGAALSTTALGGSIALAAQSNAKSTVNVQLKEFKITPGPATVKAGSVTFKVKNVGKTLHEFVVIKTTAAPGKLKVTKGEASEAGAVGEVPDVKPGKSGSVTLNLKKGKYVFICNVSGHYLAGQYVGFTVK